MELGLKGKVILVTGAGRGIGAAIATALAHQGADVIINFYKNKAKAEELLGRIKKNNGSGMIIQADVRDRDQVNRMADTIIKEYGKIDVLVNNANIDFPVKPFTELSWEDIEAKITGEMRALYNASQAVLKDMLKRKQGKLIFISSGLSRRPGYGFSAHAAAKSAVDGIAKVMALELGMQGITVNVVGPGLTLTDAISRQPEEMLKRAADANPLKRIGKPGDIAGAVVFLASSLSDYITGQYIPVNGGSFMI
jgi:3-oxoacyl-[acyl-carrier protein] reductase